MKKVIVLAFLLFPVFAGFAGAQSVEISALTYGRTNSIVVTCAWEADGAGDITFDIDETVNVDPSEDGLDLTAALLGKFIGEAVTIPDTGTAPTADYDITVQDGDALSYFGTALIDRSATLIESTIPQFQTPDGNAYGGRVLRSTEGAAFKTLTITITGAGAGGKGVLRLVLR